MNEQNREFIERARKVLQQSDQELDAATRAALTRARAEALDRSPRERRQLTWKVAPLAGLAVAVLLLLVWSPLKPRFESNLVDDLGLLAAEDSIEFYEEIEFCLWLSEENHETSATTDPAARPAPDAHALWQNRGRDAGLAAAEPAGHGTAGISRHLRGPRHGLARPFRDLSRG